MVKEVGRFSKWDRASLERMLLFLSNSKTFNALQVFKKSIQMQYIMKKK